MLKIDRQIKNNISFKRVNTSKLKLNPPLSDQRTMQEKIISNLASYLSTIGTTTLIYHKLLHWRDIDDREDEEIEKLLNSRKRKFRL